MPTCRTIIWLLIVRDRPSLIAVKAELSLALEKTTAKKRLDYPSRTKKTTKITCVFRGLLLTGKPVPED